MSKLFLFLTIVSFNQITTQSKELNQCNYSSEKHEQFDFWLSNWNAYNSDGKLIETNTITKNYSECILKEEWGSTVVNLGINTHF